MNYVHIRGAALHFLSKKPVENEKIYATNQVDIPHHITSHYPEGSTRKNGSFLFTQIFYKDDSILWLYFTKYAPIKITNLNPVFELKDTIDIGNIYLVEYNNEYRVEYYNYPKKLMRFKNETEAYTPIDTVLRLFRQNLYGTQTPLPVKIVDGTITRCSMKGRSGRSTKVEYYKVLLFRKEYIK